MKLYAIAEDSLTIREMIEDGELVEVVPNYEAAVEQKGSSVNRLQEATNMVDAALQEDTEPCQHRNTQGDIRYPMDAVCLDCGAKQYVLQEVT
jgi:hypothetical protein